MSNQYFNLDSDGRPYEPIDLATQFAKFAAMVKEKQGNRQDQEAIGLGQESSPLASHGANILHEKEKE